NGVETLTQVRIKECVTEPDGEFAEKDVKQIKELEPGRWRTFRKGQDGKWTLHQHGTMSLNKVALAPVYINRTSLMCGAPPLEKLAELNVAHWQSSSDQRNILHVARVPILFGAGFGEDAQVTVGAATMMRSSDPNAKLSYVEHTGAAIGAGQAEID